MPRVVFGVVVLLILAGCNRPPSSEGANVPPRFESGAAVRDALVRSGLGCDGFQPVSPHQREPGEEDAAEADTCRIDNEDVSIAIWRSLGQMQDWTRSRAVLGCQFADALGGSAPMYVDGGRWTVTVKSRDMADRISKAIGGEPRFTDCSAVD